MIEPQLPARSRLTSDRRAHTNLAFPKDTAVSISTAGELVTAYALGIAVGAPLISTLTRRFGRRSVLRVALAVFVAGNVIAVVAMSFGILLVARVLTGSLHGLVAGVAAGIAAGLVVPERRGQAISLVVTPQTG